jgi:hypothetical protein
LLYPAFCPGTGQEAGGFTNSQYEKGASIIDEPARVVNVSTD